MIRYFLFVVTIMMALGMSSQTTEKLIVRNGKVEVVKVDTTKTTGKQPEKVGDYNVNGKTVTVYKGARGGYFYYTGKTDKNGKPVKKYIKVEKL